MNPIKSGICIVVDIALFIAAFILIQHQFASQAVQWFTTSVALFMMGFAVKKFYDSMSKIRNSFAHRASETTTSENNS